MNDSSDAASPSAGIPRTVFAPEHEEFRRTVRAFLARAVVPHHATWEEKGQVSRAVWLAAGAAGILCTSVPEEYGGPGGDFLYDAVVLEELGRAGTSGPGWDLHSYIVAPYILRHGSEAQKQRWLPAMAAGRAIASIGLTEPEAGSDLQAMRTTARREGGDYVIDGAKTFITNGIMGDLLLLAAKTEPAQRAHGISLFLVDTTTKGYRKGRNLKKIGMKASDTAELFFTDMRVPADGLLGTENAGWGYLMGELVQERLIVAVKAVAVCEAALAETIAYTKARRAFGRAVFEFQNSRFALAELASQIALARVFTDKCIELHAAGRLGMQSAAIAKLRATELQDRVLDACLQLHGGNGYMWEFPIARAWADARVQRIYAGTNEIMREIIGRTL